MIPKGGRKFAPGTFRGGEIVRDGRLITSFQSVYIIMLGIKNDVMM